MNETLTSKQIVENREKWAKALESGEYQQCQYTMFDGKGHCCLGVAAVVLLNETPRNGSGKPGDLVNYQLYASVENALGLPLHLGRSKFTDLNDNEKRSFKEIAEEVRKLPPPL